MPRTIEVKLYQFDELSDKAKEKARQWWRECRDSNDLENVIEDAQRMGEMLGIDFDTHEVTLMSGKKRHDVSIWWELGYSQGDHAAFDGRYTYKPDAYKAINKETGGSETKLLNIAAELDALQKELPIAISGSIKNHHYYGLQVDMDSEDEDGNEIEITPEQEKTFREAMRDFCRWVYDRLREEDQWQSEDQQVDDAIHANAYEFNEDGSIA